MTSSARTARARRRCSATSPARSRLRATLHIDGRDGRARSRGGSGPRGRARAPDRSSRRAWRWSTTCSSAAPRTSARSAWRGRTTSPRSTTRSTQLDLVGLRRPRRRHAVGRRAPAGAVARALAQDAPIVLLDEPTTALDVGHQQQVLELVDELRRQHGLTVVATMHDLTLAGAVRRPARSCSTAAGWRVDGTAAEVLTEDAPRPLLRRPGPGRPRRRPARSSFPIREERHDRTAEVRAPRCPPSTCTRSAAASSAWWCVNTGDGKGKSTAAFGVISAQWHGAGRSPSSSSSSRASGRSARRRSAGSLGVDWWTIGEGFTWDSRRPQPRTRPWPRRRGATRAPDRGRRAPAGRPRRDHVPDELGLDRHRRGGRGHPGRPPTVNIVCTGRDAPDALVEVADTVTEMRKVKHAYDTGHPSQEGHRLLVRSGAELERCTHSRGHAPGRCSCGASRRPVRALATPCSAAAWASGAWVAQRRGAAATTDHDRSRRPRRRASPRSSGLEPATASACSPRRRSTWRRCRRRWRRVRRDRRRLRRPTWAAAPDGAAVRVAARDDQPRVLGPGAARATPRWSTPSSPPPRPRPRPWSRPASRARARPSDAVARVLPDGRHRAVRRARARRGAPGWPERCTPRCRGAARPGGSP